jgi:hypothetical protein
MTDKKENSGMKNKEIVKEAFEGGISYTLGLQLSGNQRKNVRDFVGERPSIEKSTHQFQLICQLVDKLEESGIPMPP